MTGGVPREWLETGFTLRNLWRELAGRGDLSVIEVGSIPCVGLYGTREWGWLHGDAPTVLGNGICCSIWK